jgi:hypothetical protein
MQAPTLRLSAAEAIVKTPGLGAMGDRANGSDHCASSSALCINEHLQELPFGKR